MRGKRVLVFLVLALALGAWAMPAQAASSEDQSWTSDRDLLLFFDAVTKIKKHAVKKQTTGQIVRRALDVYLPTIDPYSQYLTKEQFAKFKKLQSPQFYGVGMEIARDQRRRIICLPYPGGPANRAGVKGGDRLLKVDDKSVAGLTLAEIATMIRGIPKSFVDLLVHTPGSKPRKVRAIRTKLRNVSVSAEKAAGVPVIRIIRFSNTTPRELRALLRGQAEAKALVLDLRSNPGGDLASAVDAAALFLPKGRVIAEVKGRGKSQVYRSTSPPVKLPAKIYLWQNGSTASAAEVFIAALTQNRRAVSIGHTTFGKGVRQSIIPLMDGSALILSDAKILTPNGTYYHGKGLKPDHALGAKEGGRKAYVAAVKQLMAAPPAGAAPPEVQVSLKSSRPAAGAGAPLVFVACFGEKFKDQRAAEVFSAQVQRSVDSGNHYLIRLKDGRYRVCTGPYPRRDTAEAKQQEIVTALSDQRMFVLGVSADTLKSGRRKPQVRVASAPVKPAKPAKPAAVPAATEPAKPAAPPAAAKKAQPATPAKQPKPAKATRPWAIGAGSFSADTAKESALAALRKFKKHGLPSYVEIRGFKNRKESGPVVEFFKAQGFKARWLLPCDQGPDRCKVQYWVYVGPYPKKDEALLRRLTKEKKVPTDAYWVRTH